MWLMRTDCHSFAKNKDNLSEEITECTKENDQIYGILSKRIMNTMKLL